MRILWGYTCRLYSNTFAGLKKCLRIVLCRVAADGPSISFDLASISACTLQSASHCGMLQKTEDERDVYFEHNLNASRMAQYSLCVPPLDK